MTSASDPRKPGDTAEAPFMARYRELEAELATARERITELEDRLERETHLHVQQMEEVCLAKVKWERRAQRAEAEAARLREALTSIEYLSWPEALKTARAALEKGEP